MHQQSGGNGLTRYFDPRLTMGNLIVIATMLFGFGGFYYTSKIQIETNSENIRQGAARDEVFRNELQRIALEDQREREKLRLETLTRAEQTGAAAAAIQQRLAVLETKLEAVRSELQRLNAAMQGRAAPAR